MQAVKLAAHQFERDGFYIVRELASLLLTERLLTCIAQALDPLQGPAEFEAEVGYHGAPSSREAPGGNTPRRLLHTYSRDAAFRDWAHSSEVGGFLRELMHADDIAMSQCHHNCVMTKQPGFSSETMWHQDIRYWSFDRPELVSVWLALGEETADNGGLWIIPGSHKLHLDRGRLDAKLFLRQELPENQQLIERAQLAHLYPGDVLFFHCRVFHAAGPNTTDAVKLSAVSTYHELSNAPIPGTRSVQYPSVEV
jgi:phytanoyl-CoA hydroxylase